MITTKGQFDSTIMPSSVVKAMHYDAQTHTLRILYVSGIVYDYKEVPAEVYEAMKNSGSKGIFINAQIKGKYEFKKVDSDR